MQQVAPRPHSVSKSAQEVGSLAALPKIASRTVAKQASDNCTMKPCVAVCELPRGAVKWQPKSALTGAMA
eukprot:1775905-Alexandrium_andersonii.AAC.1